MSSALPLIFSITTRTFGLPIGLIDSICYVESHYNVNAIHHDDGKSDSLGVCQIKFSTAKGLGFKGTPKTLMLPYVNIYFASMFLRQQLDRYRFDVQRAIVAYNRGNATNIYSTKYSNKVINQWRTIQNVY